MSLIVNAQTLTKSFGTKPLFSDLSFGISAKDRLGIIGPNGSGKSTLLRMIAGLEPTDSGTLTTSKGMKTAYCAQQGDLPTDQTCLAAFTDVLLRSGKSEDEAATIAARDLNRYGFRDPYVLVGSLSGGWQKRLSLAVAFAQSPDLLLLDEPTNHLDWEGLLWLDELLRSAQCAWAMVSHDRQLLTGRAERIIEINSCFEGGLFASNGNYETHCAQRDAYMEEQSARADHLQSKVRREEAWLAQGVKARGTKSRSRIEEAHRMQGQLAQMKGRLNSNDLTIQFDASGRKTKDLVTLKNVTVNLGGRKILDEVSCILRNNSVTGILGRNGSGKTTLLRVVAGLLTPDSGTVVTAGSLRVIYFDQEREQLNPTDTLKSVLLPSGGDSVVFQGRSMHVVSWSQRFGFYAKDLDKKVSDLSGGEKARALMARLLQQPADLLLLDEPTNDLDIETIEVLEGALSEFPGAVVIVSHDRFLLEGLCQQFISFTPTGVQILADFAQWFKELKASSGKGGADNKKGAAGSDGVSKPKAVKLSYKEQREFDGMEAMIATLEGDVSRLEGSLNDPAIASRASESQRIYLEIDVARKKLDKAYERWTELESKVR